MRPLRWWAVSAPTGGDKVKVSENLSASAVIPIALVVHPWGILDTVGSINDGLSGNLRELAAEVEVPCVSRRVVTDVI